MSTTHNASPVSGARGVAGVHHMLMHGLGQRGGQPLAEQELVRPVGAALFVVAAPRPVDGVVVPQGEGHSVGVVDRAGLLVLRRLQVPQAGPQVRGVVVGAGPAGPAAQQASALGAPGGRVAPERLAQGLP
ncbi:MAG TPA: hypothetical protein VM407_05690, partial [Acidovorax sp.]|nr:hypothetical protein [Acidovorax sp.]